MIEKLFPKERPVGRLGNINGDNLIFSITTPCPTENVTYTPQDCAEALADEFTVYQSMQSVSYLIHEHYL